MTANLFFARDGKAIYREVYNRLWVNALLAVGVITRRDEDTRSLMFHQLRHAFASTLLSEGVDIRALAEYLGHEDPGFTLRIYTHLMPTGQDRARQAIDGAFRSRSSGTDGAQAATAGDHQSPPPATAQIRVLSRA